MIRNKETKNLVVGLDIGTSKIVAIVSEVKPDGMLEVIGMGMHESSGMKKGMVVNIEATVGAIQRALEEAELMADCKIHAVHTGIAGSHIRSINSRGMVKIKERKFRLPTSREWSKPPVRSACRAISSYCTSSNRNSASTGRMASRNRWA